MLSLIKKDIITTLRFRTVKSFVISLILIFITFTLLNPIMPIIFPLAISCILVFNSFYYDSLNNSERFILSMPSKKEDIVYSRYLFSLIIILTFLIITYLLCSNLLFNQQRSMVFEDVFLVLNVYLLIMSIILPVTFKYGYGKVRTLNWFIALIPSIPFLMFLFTVSSKLQENNGQMMMFIGFGAKFSEWLMKAIDIRFINFTTITLFMAIVYAFSMYVSLKVYTKKDIV